MGQDSKSRQNHYVDFWVSEKPEYVLEHNWITSTGRIEEACAKVNVKQHHSNGTREYRHNRDKKECGNQPCPNKKRHFHQCHAWSTHVKYRRYDINAAHDG